MEAQNIKDIFTQLANEQNLLHIDDMKRLLNMLGLKIPLLNQDMFTYPEAYNIIKQQSPIEKYSKLVDVETVYRRINSQLNPIAAKIINGEINRKSKKNRIRIADVESILQHYELN